MAKNQRNPNRQKQIRNQLVGLATLLIILAIFAPLVLTNKTVNTLSTNSVDSKTITNETRDYEISLSKNRNIQKNNLTTTNLMTEIDDVVDNSSPPSIPAEPDISNIDEKNTSFSKLAMTYIIQLAALKNKQKIEELVALLRLNNYNVNVIPKNPQPDQLIKLQVGPYESKEQAEQIIIDLNKLTKLKGIIINHD